MNIEHQERSKYQQRWKDSYCSRSADPFAHYLLENFLIRGNCLEIGCGDCTTMEILAKHGINVQGCDITLDGYRRRLDIYEQIPGLEKVILKECPVWDLPYSNEEFMCTFSTDVLEHIPLEIVDRSIKEIIRVTQGITIHQVATYYMGDDHLTVQPIEWWREKFIGSFLEVVIIERKL